MKLNDPARQLRFRLESGDVVLVINHRVLHGRTAFSVDGGDAKAAEATFGYLLPEGAKIPARWLTGTYADVDSLTSAHRTICHAIAGGAVHGTTGGNAGARNGRVFWPVRSATA